jgi:hypothetical protein
VLQQSGKTRHSRGPTASGETSRTPSTNPRSAPRTPGSPPCSNTVDGSTGPAAPPMSTTPARHRRWTTPALACTALLRCGRVCRYPKWWPSQCRDAVTWQLPNAVEPNFGRHSAPNSTGAEDRLAATARSSSPSWNASRCHRRGGPGSPAWWTRPKLAQPPVPASASGGSSVCNHCGGLRQCRSAFATTVPASASVGPSVCNHCGGLRQCRSAFATTRAGLRQCVGQRSQPPCRPLSAWGPASQHRAGHCQCRPRVRSHRAASTSVRPSVRGRVTSWNDPQRQGAPNPW